MLPFEKLSVTHIRHAVPVEAHLFVSLFLFRSIFVLIRDSSLRFTLLRMTLSFKILRKRQGKELLPAKLKILH